MKSLKLAVFSPTYPGPDRVGNMFVAVRVQEYAKSGHEVCVFTYASQYVQYQYEGVTVYGGSWADLEKKLAEFSFDCFIGHLIDRKVAWYLARKRFFSKCLLWIHGFEALGWYRDAVLPEWSWAFFKERILRIRNNVFELLCFRYLIFLSGQKIRYIFVSQWMRRMSQLDLLYSFPNYGIIPNPIKTDVFVYQKKPPEQRLKVWFMRTYDHPKYAADIALESLRRFSKHPAFQDFEFLITGFGQRFEELTQGLGDFSNVRIEKRSMSHAEIAQTASEYGVFLSPTRQDAQGVSMCEAMSCGMLVISSNSTAIPEFVKHEETGLLTSSVDEIVEALLRLHQDAGLFEKITAQAAEWVRKNLNLENVIQRELAEIQKFQR